MPYVRKLIGSKTYLSPVIHEDAALLYRWHSNLETVFLAQGPGLRSSGTAQEFKDFIDSFHKKVWPMFMIVDLASDEPIGWCALWNIKAARSQAEVAILIGEPDRRGQGRGSDALRLLLDHGFNLRNLNRVELETAVHNTSAIRCYEKVGFKHIGTRRQAYIHGQKKTDSVLMDLLAEEFDSPFVIPMIGGAQSGTE